MLYNNLTLTIAQRQSHGYPVQMDAEGAGRVSDVLAPPPDALLRAVAAMSLRAPANLDTLRHVGEELFRWLFAGALETQLRIAWDRAERTGRGLRIRLSVDSPEIGALPWELLYDPARNHLFSTSISTLFVRYLDQANRLGGLADQSAELPLSLLLTIPETPDLDAARERNNVEEALLGLQDLISLTTLDGVVTRHALSDALLEAPYHILHFAGHGAFAHGEGFIALNLADGQADIVDAQSLSRLLGNHRTLRLVVLNACSTGQTNSQKAFVGLALELVSRGVPAVVAMQTPVVDAEASTFAHEFYQQLSTGENAGQVDVALTHARNMLAVLYPRSDAWAAPMLYTHARDGVLFDLSELTAKQTGAEPARAAMLIGALQNSMELTEDWEYADPAQLKAWRKTLKRAEQAYSAHLDDPNPDAQQAARYGLALITGRLEALEMRLAAAAGRAPA